jgi:fructose-1,6-bisphosphatase/inositol monophosphatase family enzyme
VCCGVDYPKLIDGEADYLLYGHTNPWDHLPGTLMVAEAGGASAHADGAPYTARSTGRGLVVASDPATLARAVEAAAPLWPSRS